MTATGSLRRGLVAACLLLAAFSAALAQPVPGVPVDGLGRPVSAENQAAFERTLASIKGRKLSPVDAEFLLTVLNSPPVPSGPFKDREALARHFARAGVGVSGAASGGMAETDLWRLVRAARAASQAYRIPPAILLCLTFRESGFNRSASAWTTSAKGVSQMTNGAVADAVRAIQSDPALRAETEAYARELGAEMPDRVEGAADVDGLTRRMEALRAADAPREDVEAARRERQAAILSHKDEVGHIYNIETNFGLAAAYLSLLRYRHFAEVADEPKAWLTAVAAYNQGRGFANKLIYDVFRGPAEFNSRGLDEVFGPKAAAQLGLSPERQQEMLGEVGSVRACALP
jgi:hypothetical protein